MKKIFLSTLIIFYIISANTYGNTPKDICEKQLVEIYTVALDSFLPEKESISSIYNKDYLAIDMSSAFFESISQEGKQQILDYFKNKYNIEVMNASLDTLKEKGLVSSGIVDFLKKDSKEGLILGIHDVKFKSESEAVINGYWFYSGVSARSYKSTIALKKDNWILTKKIGTGIS